jgi:SAM-dependent methyltransferase
VPYDPTIYLGCAAHYRAGRPPYSPDLEAVLIGELGLDGTGRLLDGGCGPGIIALRLAGLFDEVVGLDPDPDMLEEGRQQAEAGSVANIRWVCAWAEDLPAAAPGPYRLVTFGQSFHWTDEHHVAEVIYDMLEPGGALAMVVHTVDGRYAPVRTHRFEDVLVETRFGKPRSLFAPGTADLIRDTQCVISGYLSMSWSAPHLFGDRLDDFTGQAREMLDTPDRQFWDWQGDTEIVLAVKP